MFTLGIGRGVTDQGILREGIVYVTRAIEASRNELAKQRFGRKAFWSISQHILLLKTLD